MSSKILAVGEVLWDLLPSGKQLGGAPANFSFHCRSLGARSGLVARVGDDDLGREVLERFRILGLPAETVQVDPAWPTGTVGVTLAADGTAPVHHPRERRLGSDRHRRVRPQRGPRGRRRLLRQPRPAE